MTPPEFIYLHGFASSPGTRKASFFKTRLSSWGISLRVPDLNVPSFSALTLTSMIERLAQEVRECSPAPVNIIASSLGAKVALHFVDGFKQGQASGINKLMFLAPSFDFVESRLQQIGSDGLAEWKAKGRLKFYHHLDKRECEVGYGLIDDLAKYNSYHAELDIPVLIFHGRRDKNVPFGQSVKFVERNKSATLEIVDADHILLDQLDGIWSKSVRFFDLCAISAARSRIKIRVYNLASAADAFEFKPYEGKFLDVLEAAYGDKFYARDVQLNRIYGKDHNFGAHYVFLAFFKGAGENNLVGCSYIRPDGKRSATAVLPEYQGRGIARRLICESLNFFEKQYTEISPSDLRMRHLVVSLGFTPVVSESDLKHYLGKMAHLLRSVRYEDHTLLYRRSLPVRQGDEQEFVMFKYQP